MCTAGLTPAPTDKTLAKEEEKCPHCEQLITLVSGVGFGQESKKHCACKDPFHKPTGQIGW